MLDAMKSRGLYPCFYDIEKGWSVRKGAEVILLAAMPIHFEHGMYWHE